MTLHRLRIFALSFSAILLLCAADGPIFNGCGSSAPTLPPEGTPFPPTDAMGCATPADCSEDECADFECIAGACVATGVPRDADGDGDGPVPCGGDCNDDDPFVFGGAFELCDGIDNDCDGSTDEGLTSWGLETAALSGTTPTSLGALSDIFVVAQASRSAVFARRILPGPQVRSPVEVMRLAAGTEFLRVELAESGEGRLTLLALTDLGTILHGEMERRDDGELREARPREILDTTVSNPELSGSFWFTAHAGGVALAYLTSPSAGVIQLVVQRSLDAPPWPISTGDLVGVPAVRGFASDGVNLAVGVASEGVIFLGPDGSELSRTPFPSSSEGSPFNHSPLASGDGHITRGMNMADGSVSLSELSAAGPVSPIFTGPLLYGQQGNTVYANGHGTWTSSVEWSAGTGLQLLPSGSSEFSVPRVSNPYADAMTTTRFASYASRTALLATNSAGSSVLYIVSGCGP